MGDPSRPFRSSAQLVKAVLSTLAMISSLEIVKTEVLKNNYVSSIVLTMRMVRGTRIPVLTPVILFRRDREPRPRAELRYSKPAKSSFRDSTTATVTAPRALLLAQLAKHGNAASPTLRGRRASLSAPLVDNHVSLQTHAVNEGAVEVIMSAMEWFPQHGPLQQWACFALFNLSFNHTPNKLYLVKQGALGAVLEAMRAHPALELNRHGVGVLFNVLRSEKDVDTFAMRQVALNAGLVEVLQAASMRFRDEPILSQMASQILADTAV